MLLKTSADWCARAIEYLAAAESEIDRANDSELVRKLVKKARGCAMVSLELATKPDPDKLNTERNPAP